MKTKQALTLTIFLALAVTGTSRAQDDDRQSPAQVAYIGLIQGDVGYQRGDDSQAQWSPAVINTLMMPGDSLYASDRGRAEVQLGESNFLRLGRQGYIGLLRSDDRTFQFKVASGTATLRLRRLDRNYEIDTPNFAFSVQRTGEYRVDVNPDNGAEITLYKGRGVASITEQGEEEVVAPARLSVANGSDEFTISRRFEGDDWDRWNRERDSLDYDTRPQYIPPGVYGYESMNGYGRWVQNEAYGPVWIPAMGPGWQPYRLGRWVWVDPYGWTWVSYESWGWAPYHYGRWACIEGVGWAWVPGPPTVRQRFAAALVAFLTGNEGGAWVGWFPLGPGEVYQPYATREVYVARPVAQYVNYNYVTVVNRTEIYNSTTVVYNTRIVNRQVIENTQVVQHCDIPPSRQTLYTPAVRVTGNQVVAVSNTPHPAPRPTEQIIQRDVRVRTEAPPPVRKFDDKLAEMRRAGVVRPVNPFQTAQSAPRVNPGQGNLGAKVVAGKPNPPEDNEHGRPAGMPPGLFKKTLPPANSSVSGAASLPPATRNAPATQAPAAAEDQPRHGYQPPDGPEGRAGRPANASQVQEQARPKYEPPQEVERRLSQPGTAQPEGEQPNLAAPRGQAGERRPDEPQPVSPAVTRDQARPPYQPPQEAEKNSNRPEAEPAESKKPNQPAWAPPTAARARQDTSSTQPADVAAPHQAPRAAGPAQSEHGAQPDSRGNGHRPFNAAATAQPPPQSRQVKQADTPPPPKSESKQKSSEDEDKGKKN